MKNTNNNYSYRILIQKQRAEVGLEVGEEGRYAHYISLTLAP